MTTYREAIRAAVAVHTAYRDLASSEHYLPPARSCSTVHALASWYGTDPAVYVYDEHAATYRVTDRRTYRALAVLLAVAPIGGRTYLGMALRTVAVTVAAAIAVAALALPYLPVPTCYGDDGERCLTEAEYADVLARYDVLRSERDGGRFDALATCAETNGAPLTADQCATYLAERAALADACGAISEQNAYEHCEHVTLSAIRASN